MPLLPLLEFPGLVDEPLIEAYRQTYVTTYVVGPDGQKKVLQDWTGASVSFGRHAFNHAFSRTERRREGLDHESFCLHRLQRLLWIREVIGGNVGTIARYVHRERDKHRRSFLLCEEDYLVVLDDPRKPGLPYQFVSAFPMSDADYVTRFKSRAMRVETKMAG